MAEMTGLERIGLAGNDVDETNNVFHQLERICVSAIFTLLTCLCPRLIWYYGQLLSQLKNGGRVVP
jgi:hypothetical protein